MFSRGVYCYKCGDMMVYQNQDLGIGLLLDIITRHPFLLLEIKCPLELEQQRNHLFEIALPPCTGAYHLHMRRPPWAHV